MNFLPSRLSFQKVVFNDSFLVISEKSFCSVYLRNGCLFLQNGDFSQCSQTTREAGKWKFTLGAPSNPSRRMEASKLMYGPNTLKSHLKITLSFLINYCKLDCGGGGGGWLQRSFTM